MVKKTDKKGTGTNYSFLFDCMAAFTLATAAALTTAGIFALCSKATSVATGGLLAASAVTVGASAIIAPIALTAVALFIAAACILPCLFSGRSSTTSAVTYGPRYSYNPFGLFPTPSYVFASTYPYGFYPRGHRGGTTHTHGGGTTHTHGGGTTHTHGVGLGGSGATTHTHGLFGGGGATTHTHGSSSAGGTTHTHRMR